MSHNEKSQSSRSEGLQIPGLVQSEEKVEQLSFNNRPTTPLPTSIALELERKSDTGSTLSTTEQETVPHLARVVNPQTPPTSPVPTTQAVQLRPQPAVTQTLTRQLLISNTTPLRPTVVIRGNGQKLRAGPRPPQGRRHIISLAAILLLLVITGGTLFAVSPLGRDSGLNFNPLTAGSNLIKGNDPSNLNLMAQQATATAVLHQQTDGYQPGAPSSGITVNGVGIPESWPVGVCTYWASLRYHALTGIWVNWLGNAYQWVDGATAAGWHVSTSPHVPSILVLMPGVEGASGYGHVAVVESANGNTVHTSNMNWYANGGGYDIVSYNDFTTGPGVYFVWD